MKYMLLIHHGPLEWDRLSEDEQKRVSADYQAVSPTPGVTPGAWMEPPEPATTVRVDGDRTVRDRAELLRRLDRAGEARAAYERALALVHSDAERRFLERRLAELRAAAARPPADEPGGGGRARG